MSLQPYYQPPNQTLWQGRQETLDNQRYYQKVQVQNIDHTPLSLESTIALLGFCTDLGVIRNQGRPGAKEGPTPIKQQLAGLPWHGHSDRAMPIVDTGNIICTNDDLERAQRACAKAIQSIRQTGAISCLLGGGHEIAWAHYQGLTDIHSKADFAIVNFDAHFDMRPLVDGLGHSGSPFLQVAQDRQARGLPFHYYCIGIRESSNTSALYQTAQQWQVSYLSDEEILAKPIVLDNFITQILSQHQHIYLTVCLDVFASSSAPGVSASSPIGLMPWHVLPHIKTLAQSGQVWALDVAEYAPIFDLDNRTAKLAALVVAHFVQSYRRKAHE